MKPITSYVSVNVLTDLLYFTAAHCFFFSNLTVEAKDMHVGLGKLYINYDRQEKNSIISTVSIRVVFTYTYNLSSRCRTRGGGEAADRVWEG